MNVPQLPLNQLQRADSNVRKTGAAIEDLAASIEHHGLLQNLLVVERAGQPFVVAGGRRLQALQLLASQGKLKDTHPVACKVVSEAEASELSLAENTMRQAMHPADEFEAFNALAVGGLRAAEIAVRFGATERHVAQRLKLANVSPKIIAEFRAAKATLDQVMALAIVDDHAAQEKVWKASERSDWERRPERLRASLIERDIAVDRGIGAFVGVEAYETAGGTARRDLFSDAVSLPDSKLVQKLAQKRLDAEAAKLQAKGWGWTEGRIEFGWQEQEKYRIHEGAQPSPDMGAIVTIGHGGKVQFFTGLLKPGQKAPAGKAAPKKVPGSQGVNVREQSDKLFGVRTAILRSHLRDSGHFALAALAACMASSMFSIQDEPALTLINVDADPYMPASMRDAIKHTDPESEVERKGWSTKIAAGQKKHGSVFAWLIGEEEIVAVDLLAFIGTELLLADDTDEDHVHQFAKLAGVDFASAWAPTVEWLGQQSAPYVIEAVTEACGEDRAKPLAKLKGKAIATAAHPLLMEAGWMPVQLRAPKPPEPKQTAKKAAKK